MGFEGISTGQIVTVCAFLLLLIICQIFIRKNGASLSNRFKNQKRIQIKEEIALSAQEKVRIISIDSYEFLFISNKNKGTKVLSLKGANQLSNRSSLMNKTESGSIDTLEHQNIPATSSTNTIKNYQKNTHELTDAIKVAREMNPAVSYKK